jgi:hypothetical protein
MAEQGTSPRASNAAHLMKSSAQAHRQSSFRRAAAPSAEWARSSARHTGESKRVREDGAGFHMEEGQRTLPGTVDVPAGSGAILGMGEKFAAHPVTSMGSMAVRDRGTSPNLPLICLSDLEFSPHVAENALEWTNGDRHQIRLRSDWIQRR